MNNQTTAKRAAMLTLIATVSYGTFATADDSSQWYARAIGGFTTLSDTDITVGPGPAEEAAFSSGQGFGGAVGFSSGSWRFEGEIMYRSNDIDAIGASTGSEVGDFASLGLGINALYEVDLFGSNKVRTYFGGGLVYLEEIDVDLNNGAGEVSYSDNDFGIQLMLGARYSLSPRWDLYSELRYFDAGSVTLTQEQAGSVSLDSDYSNTSVMFGVGFKF